MSAPSEQGELTTSHSEALTNLKEQKLQEKTKRRELATQLSMCLKTDDAIPMDGPKFETFINEHLYGGLSGQERRNAINRGVTIRVDKQAKIIVDAIRQCAQRISTINSEINLKSKLDGLSPSVRRWSDFFRNVSERLTVAFKQISTSKFVDSIELIPGEISDVSLSLNVKLKNGTYCSADSVFSEANLDLVALLIFLSVLKGASEHGQAKILILDDVLQSVDSTIRFAVIKQRFVCNLVSASFSVVD